MKQEKRSMQNTKAVIYTPSEKIVFIVGENDVKKIFADENFMQIIFNDDTYRRFFNMKWEIEGQYK